MRKTTASKGIHKTSTHSHTSPATSVYKCAVTLLHTWFYNLPINSGSCSSSDTHFRSLLCGHIHVVLNHSTCITPCCIRFLPLFLSTSLLKFSSAVSLTSFPPQILGLFYWRLLQNIGIFRMHHVHLYVIHQLSSISQKITIGEHHTGYLLKTTTNIQMSPNLILNNL